MKKDEEDEEGEEERYEEEFEKMLDNEGEEFGDKEKNSTV
jgi:hypothetical protein